MTDSRALWDERYGAEHYVYGTDPNDFLVEAVRDLRRGRALSLAEGEGRNAVWLASQGFEVWSVDQSAAGVAKTRRLARERGVTVHAGLGRLEELEIEPGSWDLIVSIFAHVPAATRRRVHRAVVAGLRPGGTFVLEAYAPAQVGYGTGGPKDVALLAGLAELVGELEGLEVVSGAELEREVVEGTLHTGRAAVVQLIARRPG